MMHPFFWVVVGGAVGISVYLYDFGRRMSKIHEEMEEDNGR